MGWGGVGWGGVGWGGRGGARGGAGRGGAGRGGVGWGAGNKMMAQRAVLYPGQTGTNYFAALQRQGNGGPPYNAFLIAIYPRLRGRV